RWLHETCPPGDTAIRRRKEKRAMSSRVKTSSRSASGAKKAVRSESSPRAGRGASLDTNRRLTITDIARLAGVSKKTVSRVINQEPYVNKATRERIEAIIAEH